MVNDAFSRSVLHMKLLISHYLPYGTVVGGGVVLIMHAGLRFNACMQTSSFGNPFCGNVSDMLFLIISIGAHGSRFHAFEHVVDLVTDSQEHFNDDQRVCQTPHDARVCSSGNVLVKSKQVVRANSAISRFFDESHGI